MTKPIVILKTGSAPASVVSRFGDFDQWITDGLASAGTGLPVTVHDPISNDVFPDAAAVGGVIITGSPAMVSDREPWSERAASWLQQLALKNIPMLGICFGHQLLAHAFGGSVGYHPGGIEVGTTSVTLTSSAADDPLFGGLPMTFPVQVAHLQTVSALPPGAISLAANDFDPSHAFRLGQNIWGVQFHPEFSEAVMRDYLDFNAEKFIQYGVDSKACRCAVTQSEEAASLLPRFAQYVLKMPTN